MRYYIENFGDDPCEECEDQIGKRVLKKNIGIPVKKHPNCKCEVVYGSEPDAKEETVMEETEKTANADVEAAAEATEPIKDTLVYRGFVGDAYAEDDVQYGFDETPVMICPMGEWTGGATDGRIVTQVIDAQALETLAANQEEVLVDKDHGSMKTVLDRDTRAYGWAGQFKAVTNAGDFSGLYGVIKWSDEGRKLVQDRSYRFLSPAFELDSDGRPVKLVSIGLTNRPNFKMGPIVNSVPDGEASSTTSITKDIMTLEEIKALVAETVKQALEEAAKPEEKPEEAVDACKDEEEKKETANADAEKPVETPAEEEKPETAEPEKAEPEKPEEKPAKKEPEVIKEEVLNAIPDAREADAEPWKKLHGEALNRWMLDNLK